MWEKNIDKTAPQKFVVTTAALSHKNGGGAAGHSRNCRGKYPRI